MVTSRRRPSHYSPQDRKSLSGSGLPQTEGINHPLVTLRWLLKWTEGCDPDFHPCMSLQIRTSACPCTFDMLPFFFFLLFLMPVELGIAIFIWCRTSVRPVWLPTDPRDSSSSLGHDEIRAANSAAFAAGLQSYRGQIPCQPTAFLHDRRSFNALSPNKFVTLAFAFTVLLWL